MLQRVDLVKAKPVICLLDRLELAAQLILERFLFVRQNFHFVGVLEKEPEVQLDKSAQPLLGIIGFCQGHARLGEKRLKSMTLDEIQQLFFALEIVVESRETHAGRARNIADRSAMVTARAENFGGSAQNSVQLAIEGSKLCFGHCPYQSPVSIERSFESIIALCRRWLSTFRAIRSLP